MGGASTAGGARHSAQSPSKVPPSRSEAPPPPSPRASEYTHAAPGRRPRTRSACVSVPPAVATTRIRPSWAPHTAHAQSASASPPPPSAGGIASERTPTSPSPLTLRRVRSFHRSSPSASRRHACTLPSPPPESTSAPRTDTDSTSSSCAFDTAPSRQPPPPSSRTHNASAPSSAPVTAQPPPSSSATHETAGGPSSPDGRDSRCCSHSGPSAARTRRGARTAAGARAAGAAGAGGAAPTAAAAGADAAEAAATPAARLGVPPSARAAGLGRCGVPPQLFGSLGPLRSCGVKVRREGAPPREPTLTSSATPPALRVTPPPAATGGGGGVGASIASSSGIEPRRSCRHRADSSDGAKPTHRACAESSGDDAADFASSSHRAAGLSCGVEEDGVSLPRDDGRFVVSLRSWSWISERRRSTVARHNACCADASSSSLSRLSISAIVRTNTGFQRNFSASPAR